MSRPEKAKSVFLSGFSCAQSVFSAFSPDYGLDGKTALKVASSFGGGMAATGRTCGAVTGALMVLGLRFPRDIAGDSEKRELNYSKAREFLERFESRFGTTDCREIVGFDVSTPEGRARLHEDPGIEENCALVVEAAAEMLEELIV